MVQRYCTCEDAHCTDEKCSDCTCVFPSRWNLMPVQ